MNNLGTSNRHREATLIQSFNKHLLSDFLQVSGMAGLIGLGFHPHGAPFRGRKHPLAIIMEHGW